MTITDPTGTGATAAAAIDNGVISRDHVKKPGSGYVTPGGIKKFVDTPAGPGRGREQPGPVHPGRRARHDDVPGADYYVIAWSSTASG